MSLPAYAFAALERRARAEGVDVTTLLERILNTSLDEEARTS